MSNKVQKASPGPAWPPYPDGLLEWYKYGITPAKIPFDALLRVRQET